MNYAVLSARVPEVWCTGLSLKISIQMLRRSVLRESVRLTLFRGTPDSCFLYSVGVFFNTCG